MLKKYNSFIVLFLTAIASIIIFLLLLLLFDIEKSKIELGIYIISYLFITFFYIIKQGNNIFTIKTIFVALYSIFIGLSPLAYYFNNNTFYFSNGTPIEYQYIYCILGYIFMLIGFLVPIKKKRNIEVIKEEKILYDKKFGLILLVISMLMNIFYIVKNRASFFGGNLNDGRITALSSSGIILVITGFYLVGLALLFNYYLKTKKSKLTLVFFTIINITFFMIRGNRTQIVYIFILFILIYNFYKHIKPRKVFNLFVIILLSISLLQVLRNSFSKDEITILDATYDTLQVGSININYIYDTFPKKYDFQFGKTFLINIEMMLPGPDLDFTLWLRQCIGVEFSGGGVTPTVLGEGYINFGFLGAMLLMFLTGWLANILNDKYYKEEKNIVWNTCAITYFLTIFKGGYANIEISLLSLLFLYIMYKLFFPKIRKGDIDNVKN